MLTVLWLYGGTLAWYGVGHAPAVVFGGGPLRPAAGHAACGIAGPPGMAGRLLGVAAGRAGRRDAQAAASLDANRPPGRRGEICPTPGASCRPSPSRLTRRPATKAARKAIKRFASPLVLDLTDERKGKETGQTVYVKLLSVGGGHFIAHSTGSVVGC